MDSFPIPKLRSSWMAALLLTLVAFLFYYLIAFKPLLELYRSQFDRIYFENNQNQINIIAFVPKHFNSSELTWAYLNVQNRSNNPIYDLEVYLVSRSDEATLLLPNLYKENVYNSGNTFSVIEPFSVATARIPFITQGNAIISKVILIQKDDDIRQEIERKFPTEYIQPDEKPWRALQHSFLETILLPPWSNTFILALVLFSAYLVRSRAEEELHTHEPDEPRTFTSDWWQWVITDIRKSSSVLYWMIFFTAVFVFVNFTTWIPVSCLIALQIMLSLESSFFQVPILKKNRTGIILLVLLISFWGLTHTGIRYVFIFFRFLFPTFLPFEIFDNNTLIYILSFIASLPVLIRNRKNIQVLEVYVKNFRFWGVSFLVLAIISLSVDYIIGNQQLDLTYSWWLLFIVSFILLLLKFVKWLFPDLNKTINIKRKSVK